MPVALMTWRSSALYTTGTSPAAILAGLKAAIDAEVAANPSTALWMVAAFDAAVGTLTLKNTTAGITAGGAAARRLMVFGSVGNPHADAADGASANANSLYCGVAPTAAVDVPQVAFTAGAPYTTGVWVPGGQIAGSFPTDRVQYHETFDGMVVVFRYLTMDTVARLATAFMGALAVTLDGETARDIAFGSTGPWSTGQDSAALQQSEWAPSGDATVGGATLSRANFSDPTNGLLRVQRAYLTNGTARSAYRGPGAERYYIPLVMRDLSSAVCRIKLRQIALGAREPHGTTVSDVGGVQATKVGERNDIASDGPWLTNFRV